MKSFRNPVFESCSTGMVSDIFDEYMLSFSLPISSHARSSQ
jgi:hypothetical protein